MAVIGTFSSFTTARLGIYASQASLNITGNNIANINTEGYTRQRLDLVSLYSKNSGKYANVFNTNIGYGVLTQSRSQLRDPFLDIRYRNENTNLAANTETYNGLYQISHTLDEVNKGTDKDEGYGVLQANLKNFITALEKLHVNVGSPEFDRQVRAEAESLCTFFKEGAKALQNVYDGKVEEFTQSIKEANLLLTDIRDLNEQIRTAALYGDNALELRDQRNLDLDALSELLHINVEYSMERIDQFTEVEKLTVTIADSKGADGKPIKLIDGIYGGQLSVQEREPLMNPNYDPEAINKAKTQAAEDAKAANPIDMDQVKADAEALAEDPDFLAKYPMEELSPWKEQLAVLNRLAYNQAKAEAKTDPDYAALTTTEEKKAWIEAKSKSLLETDADLKARYDEIEADWKETMGKKAYTVTLSAAKAAQQEKIDEAVKAEEEKQIAAGGKYYKADANGDPLDPPEFTNDLYVLDANGNPVLNPDGTHQFNAATFENEKFLLQVEPLIDRRERLMIDPNTVSKKSEVVELNDTVLYGKIQSQRELLTEEGEYASNADLNKDPATGKEVDPPRLSGDADASIKRGIPYYQKALDTLARQFAEEFNQANQLPATTVYLTQSGGTEGTDVFKDADGNPVQYTDEDGNKQDITVDLVTKIVQQQKVDENGKPMVDENGDPVMEDVRVPYTMADPEYGQAGEMLTILAQKAAKDPLYGFYDGGVLFSNNGNNNDPSGITASNITISHAWSTETVHILNDKRPDSYREDGSVIENSSRNENIDHMISLFEKQLDYYATDLESDSAATLPIFKGSFQEVYTTIEGIAGTDQNIVAGKMNNYAVMTLSLENDRQSVSGVDLNDEATSMMQYSKSYSAACRLLTTIDQMLDTLINGTAR
ncbi:MAG: hypothetical protein HDT15_02610 [Oscillibacter sp.]|nr:hypothetical protein [Oscillibacter sp.]